jgi:hypothetical protein
MTSGLTADIAEPDARDPERKFNHADQDALIEPSGQQCVLPMEKAGPKLII